MNEELIRLVMFTDFLVTRRHNLSLRSNKLMFYSFKSYGCTNVTVFNSIGIVTDGSAVKS